MAHIHTQQLVCGATGSAAGRQGPEGILQPEVFYAASHIASAVRVGRRRTSRRDGWARSHSPDEPPSPTQPRPALREAPQHDECQGGARAGGPRRVPRRVLPLWPRPRCCHMPGKEGEHKRRDCFAVLGGLFDPGLCFAFFAFSGGWQFSKLLGNNYNLEKFNILFPDPSLDQTFFHFLFLLSKIKQHFLESMFPN